MLLRPSSSSPIVIETEIGSVTSRPWKSASEKERLRRAPRQRSIALRTEDLPASPGPMRQFKPSAGRHVNVFRQRKFRISMKRMRAKVKQLDHGSVCNSAVQQPLLAL